MQYKIFEAHMEVDKLLENIIYRNPSPEIMKKFLLQNWTSRTDITIDKMVQKLKG
jgi:hypothetical protein